MIRLKIFNHQNSKRHLSKFESSENRCEKELHLKMKLTAEVTSELLGKLVALIQACGSEVIVHFSPDHISLCVPREPGQICVWALATQLSCFNKYQVLSQRNNSISMKVNGQQFALGLALETAPTIQIMLSRSENQPFLQFSHRSLDSLKLLQHRVPVVLISYEQIFQYVEPEWDPPTIMLHFPPLRAICAWCQNVRTVSQMITISGNKSKGELSFKAENETVTIITKFNELEIEGESQSSGEEAEVMVEMKKFKKMLSVININPAISLIYLYHRQFIRLEFQTTQDEKNININKKNSEKNLNFFFLNFFF